MQMIVIKENRNVALGTDKHSKCSSDILCDKIKHSFWRAIDNTFFTSIDRQLGTAVKC